MQKTKGEQFAGVTVALITPFRNGEVDFPALRRLVDWHVEQGTDCLAPVGTTGESPTLDHEEHERVIAAVVEQAAGRIKVMPGTGSNSTREAIRLTRARQEGRGRRRPHGRPLLQQADAGRLLSATSPPWPRPCDLPIVLYNIPGRTGSNILPETIARLAELPTIVAVKEATGSLDQASHIASLCDLTILSGDDSLTLPLHEHRRPRRGVGGRQHRAARPEGAGRRPSRPGEPPRRCEWHRKLFPLCRDMLGVATNPIPVKTAMKLLGRDTGELRLPMCPLDAAGEARIAQSLRAYGLLV